MGFILGLAIILRFILINQSLWLDESIEALALMGKMGPLLKYALADYQPPLYHFLGYLNTQLFGYSEFALRLPSLIAGVLTVYFVVKLGTMIADRRVGFIAGILAATNPLLIYYSGEGRTYALTTFFVTASFYYFLKLLKVKSRSSYVLYSIFTLLFIWTSYLSWLLLLVEGIYVLIKKRYDILIVQILVTSTLFFWVPSFIESFKIGQSTMSGSPEWGKVVGGISWKSLPLTWVKFVLGRISFTNKFIYALIVSLIAALHLKVISKATLSKISLLLLWFVPPICLGIFVAAFVPIYSYFRVLFVLPAYLLILAIGLAGFKSRFFFWIVITIQLLSLVYYWYSPPYHKENWRQVVHDLGNQAIIAMPSRAQSAPLTYYGSTIQVLEPSHEELSGTPIYYIRYVEDLFDTQKLGQANFAKSGYTITSQKVYSGIQVDVYEKQP